MFNASSERNLSALYYSARMHVGRTSPATDGDAMLVTFGDVIRQRRLLLGLTMTDVGERGGIDDGTISRIERGHLQASMTTAVRLCLALALSFDALLAALDGRDVPVTRQEPAAVPTARPTASVFTLSDVEAVVALCRRDRAAGRSLLLGLLERLSGAFKTNEGDEGAPTFSPDLVDALMSANRVYAVQIQYPDDLPTPVIRETHRTGGAMIATDVVRYIQQVRPDLPLLDKKGALTLQRIVDGETERLRLVDVLTLRDALGVDATIIPLFWSSTVERVSLLGLPASPHGPNRQAERLGGGFITIGRWLQLLIPDDPSWVNEVRAAL